MRLTLCLLLAWSVGTVIGCAAPPAATTKPLAPTPSQTRGTLLIAGGGDGGTGRDGGDGAVYAAFLRATGGAPGDRNGQAGRIVVLPTASSVPEASGEAAAAGLRALAARHTLSVLRLDQDDPAAVQQLRSADGAWFTGGDPARIVRVFRPAGPSAADAALRSMLAGGGVVGGTSAGAAMMSDPMITGGRSEQALLTGVGGGGVRVEAGMGLFPYALIDQHFFERGRLGRLIAALEHTGGRFGLGIDQGAAVQVTLGDPPTLTAIGTNAALLVDMAQATRDDYGHRTGIRLSLLGDGDRWDPAAGQAAPRPGRIAGHRVVTHRAPTARAEPGEAWAPGAVAQAIHALARDPQTPQQLRSRAFTLVFTADGQTRFAYQPDNRRDLYAAGVLLTIRRGR